MGFLKKIRAIDTLALLAILNCVVMAAYFSSISQARLSLALPLLGAMIIAGIWSWYRFYPSAGQLVSKILFPVVFTLLALSFAFVIPPGATPDEMYHFRASYYYSNLIIHADDPLAIRVEDKDLFLHNDDRSSGLMSTNIDTQHFNAVKDNLQPIASESGFEQSTYLQIKYANTPFSGIEFIHIKIPSMLGIILGRALNLSALWVYYLGMLGNLALGIVLTVLAVRIIPVGKNAMMAVALFPMTLQQFGSYSYDVGAIALSFLLIALLVRAIKREGRMGRGEGIAIATVACLLAPCKIVYAFSVLLVIFVPRDRFSSKRVSILYKLLVIAGPIIVILVSKLGTLLTLVGLQEVEYPSATESQKGPTYTLSELTSHPLHTAQVLFYTLAVEGWNYMHTMIGSIPGWLEARLAAPNFVSAALLAILAISSLKSPDDNGDLPLSMRICSIAIFVVCTMAIIVSLWMDWTPIESQVIQGVQGRYFLPVLPLVLLAMHGNAIVSNRNLAVPIMVSITAINTTFLGHIIAVM